MVRGTNINVDSGIGGSPGTRDGDEVARGREGCPCPGDMELGALRVELRGVCLMDGQSLPADEVVAGQQVRRDGGVPVQSGLKQTIGPLSVIDRATDQTELVDL